MELARCAAFEDHLARKLGGSVRLRDPDIPAVRLGVGQEFRAEVIQVDLHGKVRKGGVHLCGVYRDLLAVGSVGVVPGCLRVGRERGQQYEQERRDNARSRR